MIEAVIAFIAGMVIGCVTGLLPGLHPNTVIFLLLPLYFVWQLPLLPFILFATGMGVVHTFVSFIPSVLLGAPEGDTALAVLPGHRYLLEGRGREAIELTVYGGALSAFIAVLTLPVLFILIPPVYETIVQVMPAVLIAVLLFMIWRDDQTNKPVTIVLLSGLLGVLVLQSPATNTEYILFPLFAGLFGVSTILLALWQDTVIPPQGSSRPTTVTAGVKGGVFGFIAGILAGFLPGLGSSQSAILVQEFGSLSRRDFLVALGGITTADLFLSLVALTVIGNPRSGIAVAIQRVAETVSLQLVVTVIGGAMIAVGIGALLTRFLGIYAIKQVQHLPYQHLLTTIIIFLGIGTFVLTDVIGLIVLSTATALGLLAAVWRVRRSYCMAALIIPTILYYLNAPTLF